MYYINDNKYQLRGDALEKYLVSCCAPTLAGFKVGSMFNYNKESGDIQGKIDYWNSQLNSLGINIKILRQSEFSYLIYVYNREELEKVLNNRDVQKFLFAKKYEKCICETVLETLKKKLSNEKDFPHEIGIFLGYPLCDVMGFVTHKGACYNECGMWKVYDNVEETKRTFKKYYYCKDCFLKMHCQGMDLLSIINKFTRREI